jgi:predicted nicotinamide N-methyase
MKTDSIPLVEHTVRALTEALHGTLPMGRIVVQPLPGCPDLVLGLINADFPTGPLPPAVMHEVIRAPAYWALCWGSGLGLSQLLYRNPHWVRGKRVLDFGSGSGVAGIAALRNGAASVTACDNDADARLASLANARLNDVDIEVCAELSDTSTFDLVLMADVLYDRTNLPLLDALQRIAPTLIVADSRIAEIPAAGFRQIAQIDALTQPNLNEFDEFRTVRVFAYGTV